MIMAIQIVMDHTGDTRHHFNPEDAQALAKAEERFKKLTGLGFTVAVRTASGGVSQVRSFDPNAEETVFFPRLGGCSATTACAGPDSSGTKHQHRRTNGALFIPMKIWPDVSATRSR